MPRYFIFYKPYGVLSQFTAEVAGQRTLAEFGFPPEVYPVGRLDRDSEGLLLLTDDKRLNHRLLNPAFRHRRTYLAQVEGLPDTEALERLRRGVDIRVGKKPYTTLPAEVEALEAPPPLPPRTPPIRFRKTVPTSWLRLTLREGKNRQVRRMCAAAGLPVLRLVRIAIEDLELGDLQPGQWQELPREMVRKRLRL
ncbi:MAG: pseudouridine synthase [Bacteroidetes bacterium]|nr:MAG: pseudouridine synthase [Bacteroidota bacterium]